MTQEDLGSRLLQILDYYPKLYKYLSDLDICPIRLYAKLIVRTFFNLSTPDICTNNSHNPLSDTTILWEVWRIHSNDLVAVVTGSERNQITEPRTNTNQDLVVLCLLAKVRL